MDAASANKRSTTPHESDEVACTERQSVAVEGEQQVTEPCDCQQSLIYHHCVWFRAMTITNTSWVLQKRQRNDGQAYDLETRFLDERTGRVLDSNSGSGSPARTTSGNERARAVGLK